MSLLRHRATSVRTESFLSAGRPAAARAWFVRAMSWLSDSALNELTAQSSARAGPTTSPALASATVTATIAAR